MDYRYMDSWESWELLWIQRINGGWTVILKSSCLSNFDEYDSSRQSCVQEKNRLTLSHLTPRAPNGVTIIFPVCQLHNEDNGWRLTVLQK